MPYIAKVPDENKTWDKIKLFVDLLGTKNKNMPENLDEKGEEENSNKSIGDVNDKNQTNKNIEIQTKSKNPTRHWKSPKLKNPCICNVFAS